MSGLILPVVLFLTVFLVFEAGATLGYLMGRRDEHRLHDPGGPHDIGPKRYGTYRAIRAYLDAEESPR